jgi:hypothetical protein
MTSLQRSHTRFKLNYDKQTSKMATSVAYGTSRAALKLNVTEASLRYMPGSHHMWSLGSGATHSRNWFTAGLAGSRSQLTIMVTAPLLDFADALARIVHGSLPDTGPGRAKVPVA